MIKITTAQIRIRLMIARTIEVIFSTLEASQKSRAAQILNSIHFIAASADNLQWVIGKP